MRLLSLLHMSFLATAAGTALLIRARPAAVALLSGLAVDLQYAFWRGWPQDTLSCFVGPMAIIVAAACTFRIEMPWALAPALPLVPLALLSWLAGPWLGVPGISILILVAQLYSAYLGVILLHQGTDATSRTEVHLIALLIGTCASGFAGWTFRIFGGSVLPAVMLECVFLLAVVVCSAKTWMTSRLSTIS